LASPASWSPPLPPTTFDPVGSAAHEKANVAYVAQSAGAEQPKL
jgi:hypothetical protein